MIIPRRMKQLVAVVLESDVDSVTRGLLDAGVMHFISVRSLAGDASHRLKPVGKPDFAGSAATIRGKIESLLASTDVDLYSARKLDIAELKPVDLGRAASTVSAVEGKVAEQKQELAAADEEIRHLRDIQRQIALYGDVSRPMIQESEYSYLSMQTGAVPTSKAEALSESFSGIPAVLIALAEREGERQFFLISLKRDDKKVDAILDRHGWHDIDLRSDLAGVNTDVTENLDEKIDTLSKKRARIDAEIHDAISNRAEELTDLWASLRINELYSRIQSYFSRTAKTILFTGWVPEVSASRLDTLIRRACSAGCYLEWHDPAKEMSDTEVPVQLDNPRFLKPFEMLVRNYAVPSYGSIDPTPLVAIAYLVMFGLMFGDAGHGLVIMLIGIIGRLLYKKDNNVRHLLTLLSYCGGASIITGVLFGSYFGFRLFEPLWFDFHGIITGHGGGPLVSSIYDVLAITIYFGISVIGLGILINISNLIRKREWFELVFNKAGILGGSIYGAGVWATQYFVAHDYRQLPPVELLFGLLGIPVILLALKSPLRFARERSAGAARRLHPMLIVDFTMDWIVEVLEIFSGYLANTLSFMRVAGLGIAHEALLIAFFEIASMAGNGTLRSFSAILILILGNILIIGLEGLSAGVQSLRLNYYEFFSKYFAGTGRPYAPVSLKSKS